MRILEAGGNAFDAATCAGFVLQIVEPHLNGPGGDAPILVARAGDSEPTVICGQGPSPSAATIEAFRNLGLDLIPGTGLLSPCVPGAFGAWLTMLRDFGTMPLREVLEPAIFYAQSGHPILARAVDTIKSVEQLFRDEWTTSAAVFLPNDSVPHPGSLFTNLALGAFYTRVLEHAEAASSDRDAQIEAALSYWYEGPVAEAIDRFCRNTVALDVSGRRHGGLLTAQDLYGWRPPMERPCRVEQDRFTLFKCGAWSQGPVMLQAIELLKGFDLAAYPPEDPESVHVITEAIKLTMADRDAWYGDDESVPLTTLLCEAYAAERRTLIGNTASLELRPGHIGTRHAVLPDLGSQFRDRSVAGGGEPTMAVERASIDAERGTTTHDLQRGDTCHVDVVDRWGNMAAATPSGGWLQSNPVIPELGFALGTRMQMFWLEPGLPNSLKPRKRPRTTLTPSLAYKDGRPYLAFGTPGGDQQDQWSLQLWLSHVLHGRGLQSSIETPAFHTDHLIASFWPRGQALGALTVESRFPPETIAELKRRGHRVTVGGPWSEGRLSACSYDRTEGGAIIRAGANPRGMQGYAVAR